MAADRAGALANALRRVIADERVLEAIAATPREHFVPRRQRRHAYANHPLDIGGGQTISQPLVVARMCELLDVHPGDHVLDIGTGSGWHAALLARLGGRVVSIERDARLSEQAARNLAAAGVEGIDLRVGDGFAGLPEQAPYDAVNVAAASPAQALDVLESQLAEGGRLVAPLADGDQHLVLTRRTDGRLHRCRLEPVRFVPLIRGLAQ